MRLGALVVLAFVVATALPAGAATTVTAPTVVSITFDGTFASQEQAAQLLSAHRVTGTFYVNSGYIESPAHLSLAALRGIARSGNEIGGASLYGNDLSRVGERQARAQICDDRTTLAQLGFQVTSFAYPYGAGTARVKAAAQDCGYNSAREYAGLFRSETDCSSCPAAETLPPTDDFRIRTSTLATAPELEEQVARVEATGGGWLPLTFTRVCHCSEAGTTAITPEDLDAFVTWLGTRPATTTVRTVDEVMGGPLKPVHGTPLERLVPDPSAAISTPPLSKAPAWTLFGIGVGQAQILLLCVVVTMTIVVTFRLASRGSRHAH
ncbi:MULTISPECIES: polysaccharide deacetylase family protein [Aeromicrobium]|uniref:polysaccharide deacetylase family protein n=1 Tax=Aeromicrobium TaxID=2040 RepID=UPI000701CE7B|nr:MULTISPECIES: polysaccharide deacetylase family protein [Aeromicrobium]KQX75837.1 hypothetical protein ASD10_12020 [Aeromicrobium sp. Root472D3]MCL8250466.1 polysaccharide deacetylase family protein [Aeromicrobium fastidiosum]